MKRRFLLTTDEGKSVFCQRIEEGVWDFGISENSSVRNSNALGRVLKMSIGPDRYVYHAVSYVKIDIPSVGGFRTRTDAVKYLCIAERVARSK